MRHGYGVYSLFVFIDIPLSVIFVQDVVDTDVNREVLFLLMYTIRES